MTVTISLPAVTEELLRSRAATSGKDVSTLILEAVEEKFAPSNGAALVQSQSPEEFDRLLDEFFEANPETLPGLPVDFSRADIYVDHD
jgi:hypothetical protein